MFSFQLLTTKLTAHLQIFQLTMNNPRPDGKYRQHRQASQFKGDSSHTAESHYDNNSNNNNNNNNNSSDSSSSDEYEQQYLSDGSREQYDFEHQYDSINIQIIVIFYIVIYVYLFNMILIIILMKIWICLINNKYT